MPSDKPIADAPDKVMVALPAGVKDAAELEKLVASYTKTKEQTKLYDKAMRNAFTALKLAHAPEFETLLRAEKVKVGLPVK